MAGVVNPPKPGDESYDLFFKVTIVNSSQSKQIDLKY
jgi:hypothetical protein